MMSILQTHWTVPKNVSKMLGLPLCTSIMPNSTARLPCQVDNIRDLCFRNKEASNKHLQVSGESKRGCGRPKGSKNKKKRRGNYRASL